MVASKRGRGAKSQAAKAKVAENNDVTETVVKEDNNGESSVAQETSEVAVSAVSQPIEADTSGNNTEDSGTEAKPEDKAEEKVEPGKLLVENLPSSYLFDYQEKLKDMFSKYGEVLGVKRGPIVVTELTTTPTLSAIVEYKNKDSLDKALVEHGAMLDGSRISLAVQPSTVDTTVLVGVPFEATTEYVRLLFSECGEIAQIQEFSKTKYKILRVTYQSKDSIERAMKLDRELRINGFLVTVTKYREDDEQKASNNINKNKRQHPTQQNRGSNPNVNSGGASAPVVARTNNYRGRGTYTPRAPFRGGRGRGGSFGARGGSFGRGGGYPGAMNNYMPHGGFMSRGGYLNDGQRPNKRLRQE